MRFLFVGGCERSGTTLLQRVLCSHSRIAGGPELVFTSRIAGLFERMRADYPEEFAVRLAAHFDEAKLAEAFRGLLTTFFEETIERNPEALYVSEKTPSNIRAARTLLELFPDARFLHLVRDGRAVLASHRNVEGRLRARGRSPGRSFRTRAICARWSATVEAHFALESTAELAGRYHLVRFEELVHEPELALAKVFAFLELDLEAAPLAPETVALESSGLIVDGVWVTREWEGRSFDPSVADRWRRELPAASRVCAEHLIGSDLLRMGYPVGALPVLVSRFLVRLRARARRFLGRQRQRAEARPG